MVLLDGLDEAPDARVRKRMARMLEKATERFGECRFAVTTRPGAYQDRATLAGFDQVKIDDLSEKSVEDFLGHCSKAVHPSDAAAADHQRELLSAVRAGGRGNSTPCGRFGRAPTEISCGNSLTGQP